MCPTPTYFPLRWESTGDQWWYASPIDFAAANGHYDLVRELLRMDGNHLIKLTSLRRIRRLETVWDDEEQFHDAAACRSRVARHLFDECKSSLIRAGYGGWLMYTAASAGDSGFVRELLETYPLLVFGEGEYGVTDILYAAARSKSFEVFKLLLDSAVSPLFLRGRGGEIEERSNSNSNDSSSNCVFRWEVMNRAVHAAARGGNLRMLKQLLGGCGDVLVYRDAKGSTLLHAAASRGQVEVIREVIACFNIIDSRDNEGNTALHIAAYKGQAAVAEALVNASPSLISCKNLAGETFLHSAVSGFLSCAFRRLDKQIQLMKQLVSSKTFDLQSIVNSKNNEGRTALHTAIIGNVHSDLVELLMTVRSIDVNVRDGDGMTPLDLLKQRPRSASSEILTRQLISAGGVFGRGNDGARRAVVSHLKMQGNGNSPGTRFRISDTEIFLYAGIENTSASSPDGGAGNGKSSSKTTASERLKRALHWPRTTKEKKTDRPEKVAGDDGSADQSSRKMSYSDEAPPTTLRQRFSKHNKRTLSVRSSNASSPLIAKKKLASGLVKGVMQAMPHLDVRGHGHAHSHSKSLSKSSFSSSGSLDYKQKGVWAVESDDHQVVASCSKQVFDDRGVPNLGEKQGSLRRLRNHYLCFSSNHGVDQNCRPSSVATA